MDIYQQPPSDAELLLLELADEYTCDEYRYATYLFRSDQITIELRISWLDGYDWLAIRIHGQVEPVFEASLNATEPPVVVNDKRGVYIELAGHLREEAYSRGTLRKTLGIRLCLKPYLCIQPFFLEELI